MGKKYIFTKNFFFLFKPVAVKWQVQDPVIPPLPDNGSGYNDWEVDFLETLVACMTLY